MRIASRLLTVSVTSALVALPTPLLAADAAPMVTAQALRAHMAFLASDLLEGRGTGTRGQEIAAEYVAALFGTIGLQPLGDGGTFLQRLPIRRSVLVQKASRLVLVRDGRETPLVWGDDFGMPADISRERGRVEAPVVFVGYGVTAKERSYDDYRGIDAKGKIAVFVTGGPPSFPAAERAVYGTPRETARNAAAHGAIGLLSIRTDRDEKVLPWVRSLKQLGQGTMAWLDEKGEPHDAVREIVSSAILTPKGAEVLFASSGKTVADALASGKPRDLAVTARFEKTSRHTSLSSLNVLGALPGGDPALAGEVVVVTAHNDHLGVGDPVDGDAIYNGAVDNASGTAALLEMARALAASPRRPARTILFASVTGEERGLQGSGYLAYHLPFAIDRVAAEVNMDGLSTFGRAKDVVAQGAEHSTLGGVAERVAREFDMTVSPDPWPDQNFFVRSDQYSFVKRGIPALWIKLGFASREKGVDLEAMSREWRRTRYHAPSDDMSQPLDLEAAAELVRFNLRVVEIVASEKDRPRWNAGSFFGNRKE